MSKFNFEDFDVLNKYYFVLGVVGSVSPERKNSTITNAELLFIHEFGSPARGLPARPVLNETFKHADALIEEAMADCMELIMNGNKNSVYKRLQQTALQIENIARDGIYNNTFDLEPLLAATIDRKSKGVKGSDSYQLSDLPLFDTGQLARSIVCRVRKD